MEEQHHNNKQEKQNHQSVVRRCEALEGGVSALFWFSWYLAGLFGVTHYSLLLSSCLSPTLCFSPLSPLQALSHSLCLWPLLVVA
jgi:hypothetical protein